MSGELVESEAERPRPAHLRIVWRNPCPPTPRRPVDLAAAIEGHLAGSDGLSDEEFLHVFARRSVGARPAWADAAANV
jgi:hypothetical protein